MAWEGMESIIGSLTNQDLILPYFEVGMLADTWPNRYSIEVDSSPYYGLDEEGKPDGYFHPSTHPLLGERELYYRFHPDTRDNLVFERNSVQKQMMFAMGSAGHAVLQTQMTMTGLIKDPRWGYDIEREYINEEHHVRGRIDWLCEHPNGTRLVVEFKTRSPWLFKKQKEPETSWVAQLNLGLDAMDEDLGVLLMMEAGYPWTLQEFHVRRDRELLASIYAKFDRVRAAIAANEPPRYCCAPGSKEMDACPARYSCWLKEGVA